MAGWRTTTLSAPRPVAPSSRFLPVAGVVGLAALLGAITAGWLWLLLVVAAGAGLAELRLRRHRTAYPDRPVAGRDRALIAAAVLPETGIAAGLACWLSAAVGSRAGGSGQWLAADVVHACMGLLVLTVALGGLAARRFLGDTEAGTDDGTDDWGTDGSADLLTAAP